VRGVPWSHPCADSRRPPTHRAHVLPFRDVRLPRAAPSRDRVAPRAARRLAVTTDVPSRRWAPLRLQTHEPDPPAETRSLAHARHRETGARHDDSLLLDGEQARADAPRRLLRPEVRPPLRAPQHRNARSGAGARNEWRRGVGFSPPTDVSAALCARRKEGDTVESRAAAEAEIVRKCLARKDNQVRMPSRWPSETRTATRSCCLLVAPCQCSFFEHMGKKIMYRRYASLFFIVGTSDEVRCSPPPQLARTLPSARCLPPSGRTGMQRSAPPPQRGSKARAVPPTLLTRSAARVSSERAGHP
jgi:hypothetical protein